MPLLHPDRLFPADPAARDIARALYTSVRDLPIISPHGHTQASWFAVDQPFADPATLFVQPDHYVHRMLYSQGISLEELEIGNHPIQAPRAVWRIFAEHYFLFRGTPTRLWLDYAFENLFGLTERLSESNADLYFDILSAALQTPPYRPRALFDHFRIEVLATTDSPLDNLADHIKIRTSDWPRRILPTFRPDPIVDPNFPGFHANLAKLADLTHEDTSTWHGYLRAIRNRRDFFQRNGATATDHGHPTARTANLSKLEAEDLFHLIYTDRCTPAEAELFRAQMLTEMARLSVDDGLVMQLHPGSHRNHNPDLFRRFGPDIGADIPSPTNFVEALQPLLMRFGNDPRLTLILFTLDETTYARELAPLAGHYPALRLGPPWWFHDSPEGMLRFREQTTETAGFYNTVGFNDDTRAFLSIPGRHDAARRMDAAFLARLVAEHRLDLDEAVSLIRDLTSNLVRHAYRL